MTTPTGSANSTPAGKNVYIDVDSVKGEELVQLIERLNKAGMNPLQGQVTDIVPLGGSMATNLVRVSIQNAADEALLKLFKVKIRPGTPYVETNFRPLEKLYP